MDPFYLAIILYFAALGLAFLDIFVPSAGLLLILASAIVVAAVLFAFRSSQSMGMVMLALVAATIPAFAFVALKIWPHTPIGKRIILLPPGSAEGSKSAKSALLNLADLVGEVVVCDHDLMPAGNVKIGRRRYNAIAESGIVEASQAVEIVAVRDRSLIVRVTNKTPTLGSDLKKSVVADLHANETSPSESLLDVPADELGLESIDEDSDLRDTQGRQS